MRSTERGKSHGELSDEALAPARGRRGEGEHTRRDEAAGDRIWDRSLRTNVHGLFFCCRKFVQLAKMGVAVEIRGENGVADFSRRARGARRALVDGAAGAVWMPDGRPRVVFSFAIGGNKIVGIDLIASPERLRQIDLVVLDDLLAAHPSTEP